MSTFSKKYYSPKDSNIFLSVSWESGYKNIQIFSESRLVYAISQPGILVEGIKFEDAELGIIKICFTSDRPRKLEIKVNKKKYKTINKIDLGYDYTGLITIFTSLAFFAVIENFMFGGLYGFEFSNSVFTAIFFVNFVIVAFYGITSYFLRKKKPAIYFVGASIFLITTLISIYGFSLILRPVLNNIFLIFRISILLYILFQGKHILKELRKTVDSNESNGLIDNL